MGLQSTLPPLWYSSDGDPTLSPVCNPEEAPHCDINPAHPRKWDNMCSVPSFLPSLRSDALLPMFISIIQVGWTPKGFWVKNDPPPTPNLYLARTWLGWLFWETSEWDAPEVQPERISEKHSFHCSEENVCTQIMCWSWFYPTGRMNIVWLTPRPMDIWGIVFSRG